jgi:hypothetical protein
MAVAAAAAAVDRKKSVFRKALTALRYAVAAAVTVVVVMTAVYAFHVVARTDDLNIDVVNSYISVDPQNGTDPPKLSFTLSVDNPSGRVRFYYTDIQCVLKVNDSSIHPSTFGFPDMVVAPDSVLQIDSTDANLNTTSTVVDDLFGVNQTLTGNLTLKGNLTVGVYSAYNKTRVPTTYYCMSLTVGNVSGPSSDTWYSSCITDEDRENSSSNLTTDAY